MFWLALLPHSCLPSAPLRGHAYTVGDLADGWWTLSNDRGDSFRIQYDEDEDCWYDEGACGFMLYPVALTVRMGSPTGTA